jgi:DNA-binding beta-propeller fold protein YncE
MSARAHLVIAAVVACGTVTCGEEVPVYDGQAFTRDPPPVGALHGKILVSNTGDDTLSVVDPDVPGAAPARLPVGFNPVELEGPHHVAADSQGRFVYVNLSMAVAGSGSGPHGVHGAGDVPGWVLKLDAVTAREVGRVRVDPNPGDNALSPDGRTLFVTHFDLVRWARALRGEEPSPDSALHVVDTDRMLVTARVPLCPAAHGVRPSADGGTVYVACGSDELAVVDLRQAPPAVRRVRVPGGRVEGATCQRCPYSLSVAPDGTVWVANLGPSAGQDGRGSVDVFDPGMGEGGAFDPARRIDLRGSPMFPAFHGGPGDFVAYVPEQGSARVPDALRVYRSGGPGRAPEPADELLFDARQCVMPHMLLVAEDGRRGHLICEGDRRGPGDFLWLDLSTRSVLGATRVGVFPDGLALVPRPAAAAAAGGRP